MLISISSTRIGPVVHRLVSKTDRFFYIRCPDFKTGNSFEVRAALIAQALITRAMRPTP